MRSPKPTVVIDTNTHVSALGWGGNPDRVVQLVLAEKIDMVVSKQIMEELSRVILRPEFKGIFVRRDAKRYISLISEVVKTVEPEITIKAIAEDDADNRFLECAVTGHADYIISGDSHLLDREVFRGIKILNASGFLNIIS